ncbi:MAG: hypothetical protein U1F67_01805 [Rubrivivax sp.]
MVRQHAAQAGARVQVVEAYRRTVPVPSKAEAALLAAAEAAPRAFAQVLQQQRSRAHPCTWMPGARRRESIAFADHPRIAEAARAVGFTDVRTLAPGAQPLARRTGCWSALQAGAVGAAGEALKHRCRRRPPLQSRPL